MSERTNVPCNGCSLCCRRDAIVLMDGERPEDYEVEEMRTKAGEIFHLVKKGPDGNCIYLGDSGCTIHDRAPEICRAFDCRRAYQMIPRRERRARLAQGIADKAVYEAGRKRLHTLTAERDHG